MIRNNHDEGGYALITSLMVVAVTSALVVGFVSQVATEQKIARNDTEYSTAFYAAEAGLEKLNADVAKLFQSNIFPTPADLVDIMGTSYRPALPGVTYADYSITGGQATRLSAALNATATTATVVSTTGWPSSGFLMIDGEEMTYTGTTANTFTGLTRGATGSTAAAHANNAPVSRSKVITIAEGPSAGLTAQVIPFSLDITARGNVGTETRLTREVQVALIPVFQFGVFSDSDLSFFAGPDFSFGGRVHSNGNIFLAEGDGTLTLAQKVTTAAEIIRQQLANGVSTSVAHAGTVRVVTTPGNFRNLGLDEGSLTGGLGSAANSAWPTLSLTTYNGNILSRATGGKALSLPFVGGTASPVELIRRPPSGEDASGILGASRFYNQASLRVLISDSEANLPGASGYPLNDTLYAGPFNYTVGASPFRPPFAKANAADPDFITAGNTDETTAANLIDGYIRIDRQNADGTWADVTMEILNLGISANQPNAILRLQKPTAFPLTGSSSQTATDYQPINLYDAREGRFRDDASSVGTNLRKLGIMNVVELDVNNLRRWFESTIGTTGGLALNNSGYITYYSDRRGNRNNAGNETGELGFEDFVNPSDTEGDPDGTLNTGEDLNANGTLETYGANSPVSPYSASTDIYDTSIAPPVAATAMSLFGPIDSSTTSIAVGSATNITTPGYYRINSEIVNCTSKSGNTLTCSRAQLGTTAAAHTVAAIDLNEDVDTSETDIDVSDASTFAVPGYYQMGTETVLCSSKAGNTLTCARAQLGTAAANHNRVSDWVSENLTNTDTAIDVGAAGAFTVPNFYRVDSEIVNCTSKTGNTLTCSRGQLGTTAAAHAWTSSTLSAAITNSTTSIPVASAAAFTTFPKYFRIENEIVRCTSKSGNTLTCTRAQLSTSSASHAISKVVGQIGKDINLVDTFAVTLYTSQRPSKNRVHYFRRALRLVNGGAGNLPMPGFTVAAENPVYVLGDYNATGSFDGTHAMSAVIADAVTLLSNSWINGGDDRSFIAPYSPGSRSASTTWYRMAIAAGKGINFPKGSATPNDYGTDGGTHNFLRYLESWSGATSNYRGSIVSLYYYRQAIGPYKCCTTVYSPPTRSYAFDTDFLIPSQLPPGTPRFRDINNLSFRQTIRSDSD